MAGLLEYFLVLYLFLFLSIAVLWRSWLLWRRTGLNAFQLQSKTGVEGVNSLYFRLLPLLSITLVVAFVMGESCYSLLGRILWLEHSSVRSLGVILMVTSLVWVVIAQIQMGSSWRIGIDEQQETTMIAKGLFTLSRNPIFLGIIVSALGLFLVLPNAFSLAALALDIALIQVQVQLEEAHLLKQHGSAYESYQSKVRRWI